MRKLTFLCASAVFAVTLLLLGYTAVVWAKPLAAAPNGMWLPQYRPEFETNHLITQPPSKFTFPEAVLKPSYQDYKRNFDLKISFREGLSGNKTNQLSLVSSSAYTIYLPIIFVPPPPKKGVGAPFAPTCTDFQNLKVGWYLTWGVNPAPACGGQHAQKFVPRISGADKMPQLPQAVANAQASGWLIGFSEPNLPWWTGSVSPTQGAVLWKQIEDAALPAGIKLVSPSPSQHSPGQYDPYGHQWLWAMVDAYKTLYNSDPHFDAIGWNIYIKSPQTMQTFLSARRTEALTRGYNVPIWVLEFAGECWASNSGNGTVMGSMSPWFEATPWIGRYAWFASRITGTENGATGWQSCSLVNPATGTLTSLGQLYAGY